MISAVVELELRQRAGQNARPYREVVRARIVLLAAEGRTDVEIAEKLDCTDRTVVKWRRRFTAEGLAGLDERLAPGRPRSFPLAGSPRSRRWLASFRPSRGRPISALVVR